MRTLILAALALLTACDNPLSPEERIAGTYTLESINARPLPYDIFGVLITEGSLSFYAQGTYTAHTTSVYEDWDTGEMVTENSVETGRFTITDNRVRLTSEAGEEIFATFDGREVRIDAGLVNMVYRRE